MRSAVLVLALPALVLVSRDARAEGSAWVHVDADEGVTLRRPIGRFGKHVCAAPCDADVPVPEGSTFMLRGTFNELPPFTLEPGTRQSVRVDGNFGAWWFGFGAAALGAGSLTVGGAVWGLESLLGAAYDNGVPMDHQIAYGGLMAGGVALLALGVPLLVAFRPRIASNGSPSAPARCRWGSDVRRRAWVLAGGMLAAVVSGCAPRAMPRARAVVAAGTVTQDVHTHVDSPLVGAVLVKEGDGGGVVCEAPCDRVVTVERGAQYSILAPHVLPTNTFTLYSKDDTHVWLDHTPHTPGTLTALRIATITSGVLGLGLLIGAAGMAATSGPHTPEQDATNLGLGISGLIIGIPVAATFGGFTAAHADSDATFEDPELHP